MALMAVFSAPASLAATPVSLVECARQVEQNGYVIEAMQLSDDGSQYQFETSWQGHPWSFSKTLDCRIP